MNSTLNPSKRLSKDQKRKNKNRFWNEYIKKQKWRLVFLLINTGCLIALGSIIPFMTQRLIDDYLPKYKLFSSNDSLRILVVFITGLVSLVFTKSIFTWIAAYFNRVFQQRIELHLKKNVFNKIMKLKVREFDEKNEGYFIGRMMSDTERAAEYARFIPENMLIVIVSASTNFSFIFYYNIYVGIAGLAAMIILLLITMLLRNKFHASWADIMKKSDDFNTFFVNSVGGIREIKNFNSENKFKSDYEKISASYANRWRKQFSLMSTWFSLNTLILSLLPIMLILISITQVINNTIGTGELIALLMYSGLIVEPINKLIAMFDIYMRGAVSLNRLFVLLDAQEENYSGEEIEVERGTIEFRNVSLSYDGATQALNNFNLKIKHGETIAIVGETGSGKSTVLKAILKHYDISSGDILIDGQSIKNVSVSSLRKSITYMSQEPFLSNDTIFENISFGGNQEYKKISEVVKTVQADNFIDYLDKKLDTRVGPRGVTLSGGQRQRIALARVLLKNSKILLLDEATSALDNKVESLIKVAIDSSMSDTTKIIVAHRMTTIKDADRIVVVDKGKILEVGNHDDLMQRKGVYFDLVHSS